MTVDTEEHLSLQRRCRCDVSAETASESRYDVTDVVGRRAYGQLTQRQHDWVVAIDAIDVSFTCV